MHILNPELEVAIVGAGPYALSLAAHLSALAIDHRIFGDPMSSWRTQMPQGMCLKSDGFASNLYDPTQRFTLKQYCAEQGLDYADEGKPVRLETFCAYGLAFQQRMVPALENRFVTRLEENNDRFTLHLDDGQRLQARNVVLATGLSEFQQIPDALAGLPTQYCSHSSACRDLTRFRGGDVTVVGGGASAIDIAGLLHAAGVSVRLVTRRPTLEFHTGPGAEPRSLWQRLSQPQSTLGPSMRSFLYSKAPMLFRHLPRHTRLRIAANYLGPAGGWFMRDQILGKVPLMLGLAPQGARVQEGRVHLTLTDATQASVSEIITDHVIAATGYAADLRRLSFLDDALRSQLRVIENAPVLSSRFETSKPGLYMIGVVATKSFGPVMRFMCGADFTARRLSQRLAQSCWRHVAARTDRYASVRE